jgi:pyruvate/2-oxoglutarate dehydrogenase complex dihydrolipoamide acyltransferase (E2) component
MEQLMKMPDLSTTDSPIKLVRWLVAPGQSIRRGQPLCEIETDKAASEVESVVTGVLKEFRAQAGSMIMVGQEIALFETEAPSSQTKSVPAASPASLPAPQASPAKGPGLFARNRAGTPGIVLSQPQQTLARRMQASKQNIPHFYLQASANAEGIVRCRNATSPKLVWEAFFVAAIGKALKDFERIRWRLDGDKVTVSPSSAVGVAVDANSELYVAAINTATGASVEEISKEIRTRAKEIQDGTGDARGIRPAAMTVTNLGASAVESFFAIINPPEVAILAIGRIGAAPVVQDGKVVVQQRVALTLSADHRIINGKYAADFLSAIIREIESF